MWGFRWFSCRFRDLRLLVILDGVKVVIFQVVLGFIYIYDVYGFVFFFGDKELDREFVQGMRRRGVGFINFLVFVGGM